MPSYGATAVIAVIAANATDRVDRKVEKLLSRITDLEKRVRDLEARMDLVVDWNPADLRPIQEPHA